jgi:glucose/mannose-6-phosphate isomerase
MATVAPGLTWDAVAAVDPTAQAGRIIGLGRQLEDALARVDAAAIGPMDAPGGLIVAGMGGSAVGARLAVGAVGPRARRPLHVVSGHGLPSWAGRGHVVLCSSYSGGTEETLACYDDARARGMRIVAATAGGALAERAGRDGVPVIALPSGFQPRAAVGYALVCALEVAAVTGAAPSLRPEISAAATQLDARVGDWGPEGPEDGAAKRLAARLHGTVAVIIGFGLTAPVAYRWKCQLNENAKVPAFASTLPEADHNEICGWASAPEVGAFSAVFLEDPEDLIVGRRVAQSARLAAAGARVVERVRVEGPDRVTRLLSLVLLGDLTSLYLAVLRQVDPAEIRAIVELKAALG